MNKRALVVSLITGILTVFLLVSYLRRLEAETSGGGPVVVLVAVQPLAPGVRLTAEMVATKTVPRAFVDSRTLRSADLSRVVGLRVDTAVEPQQTLLWTDLAVVGDDRRKLSALVTPGMRAVGIRAGDDSHASLVKPGDRVDVIANLPTGRDERDRVAVVVAQKVLVLAVGGDTGARETLGTPATHGGDVRNDEVLTVSVSLQQLQMLSLASERGKLTIGLRNEDDTRALDGVADMPATALLSSPDRPKAAPPTTTKPLALTPGGRID